jgi:hypothetical protein
MKMTRDGDAFIAGLTPRQTSEISEALSHLIEQDYSDTELTQLVGAGRETIGALVERLAGRHTEPSTSASPWRNSPWCTAR